MNAPDTPTLDARALQDVLCELARARQKQPKPFNSAHEGWAVIWEELDELWDEVRKRRPNQTKLHDEAMQVAAMAVRFMVDVCGKEKAE